MGETDIMFYMTQASTAVRDAADRMPSPDDAEADGKATIDQLEQVRRRLETALTLVGKAADLLYAEHATASSEFDPDTPASPSWIKQ
jgi:hypothetical protein